MELTPRHIQEKRFHDAFRGYSHEEVDLFLDQVAESFERVYLENQESRKRLREIEDRLAEAEGTEGMLKRTLLAAQRTADDAVEEARQVGESTVDQAKTQAGEIVASARGEAEAILAEARGRANEINQRIEVLKKVEAECRTRIKAFLHAQLKAVDQESPALPSPDTGQPPPRPSAPAAVSDSVARPTQAAVAEPPPLETPPARTSGPSSEPEPASLEPEVEIEADGDMARMFWGDE